MTGRLVRLGEGLRAEVPLTVDGKAVTALDGDTVLTALMLQSDGLGASDFGERTRAGFCLMGACQDCWVWFADGARLRACSTSVAPGMAVCTSQPEGTWPTRR